MHLYFYHLVLLSLDVFGYCDSNHVQYYFEGLSTNVQIVHNVGPFHETSKLVIGHGTLNFFACSAHIGHGKRVQMV